MVKKTNPAYLEKHRRFPREISRVDDLIDPRIPIIEFGAPRGTGKSHALKVITAKSGRIAYDLDVTYPKSHLSCSKVTPVMFFNGL